MTRQQCEKKLLSLAQQMRDAYLEYNPAGEHLSVIIGGDGFINACDAFFTGENQAVVQDALGTTFNTVNVTQYKDGAIRYGDGVLIHA